VIKSKGKSILLKGILSRKGEIKAILSKEFTRCVKYISEEKEPK